MPGYLYRTGAPFDVQLVIFGKDGTLLDSEAVRLPALKECTAAIAHTAGEPALLPALLKAGGWEDTEKGPTLAPDSVMACGTTLELAQRWIDTQPIVAARWHEAAALCAEMQEVNMHAPRPGTPRPTRSAAPQPARAVAGAEARRGARRDEPRSCAESAGRAAAGSSTRLTLNPSPNPNPNPRRDRDLTVTLILTSRLASSWRW